MLPMTSILMSVRNPIARGERCLGANLRKNDLFHTVGSSSNNPDGGGIDFVRTGAAEFVLALINVCLAVNENEVSMNPFSTVCALTLNLIVLIVFSF